MLKEEMVVVENTNVRLYLKPVLPFLRWQWQYAVSMTAAPDQRIRQRIGFVRRVPGLDVWQWQVGTAGWSTSRRLTAKDAALSMLGGMVHKKVFDAR